MRLIARGGESEVVPHMYEIECEVRGDEGDDKSGDEDGRDK